jgi:hypothetical protein
MRPVKLFYRVVGVGAMVGVVSLGCGGPAAPPAPTSTSVPTVAAAPPTAVPTPILPATAVPRALAQPSPSAQPGAAGAGGATPPSEQRQPGPASETATLAARFEAAINNGDVDGVLALFAPNAEVKIPPDRYVGQTQIGNWVTYLVDNHFAIEPGFRNVVGERASWPAEVRSGYRVRIGLPSLQGTASLITHDGLIQNYTYVLTEDSAHRHRAAQLAASEVLQDPIIVGQDAANVYGFNDVFRNSAGTLVSYRDVLTSEPGADTFYDLGGEPIIIRTGF